MISDGLDLVFPGTCNVNYRPQTKFAKVMFLHLSISHSVHRGVCLSACWDSRTPSGAHTPQEQTHTPGADTPQEQTPPPCAVHAGRYGQQAGGTHPTEMHTCCLKIDFAQNTIIEFQFLGSWAEPRIR